MHDLELVREMKRLCANTAWTNVMQLANMYEKGSYPTFAPDAAMALDLYRLACRSPDPRIAREARVRTFLVETTGGTVSTQDVAGRPMPREYGQLLLRLMHVDTVLTPGAIATPNAPHAAPHAAPHVDQDVVHTDAQNVHDHAVTAGMKRSIASLPSTVDNAYEEVVMTVLESDATPDVKMDAYTTLDSLNDLHHSTLGVSEKSALDKVWSRIRSMEPDARRDATHILVSQLASGVEHGNVVCSTGKIARILATLDGLEGTDPVIKPMWAVKEEIASLAAKVRDEGGDAREFRKQATHTYVHDLGMNETLMKKLIDEYEVGFDE